MDLTGIPALSSSTYRMALARTGSPSQALTQALAAGQSQAAGVGALVASTGPGDAASLLAGAAGSQGLATLAYAQAEASGTGAQAIQAMLGALGGGRAALFTGSDSLPVPAAALAPTSTAALVRYAYDQTQNPATALQQAQPGSTLNLLA